MSQNKKQPAFIKGNTYTDSNGNEWRCEGYRHHCHNTDTENDSELGDRVEFTPLFVTKMNAAIAPVYENDTHYFAIVEGNKAFGIKATSIGGEPMPQKPRRHQSKHEQNMELASANGEFRGVVSANIGTLRVYLDVAKENLPHRVLENLNAVANKLEAAVDKNRKQLDDIFAV